MAPQIIFGTASLGMPMSTFQDAESVKELLQTLQDLGVTKLDSGARYPPNEPGRSPELIGETEELGRRFVVDTKVFTDTATDGSGDLTEDAIDRSTAVSLKPLGREAVNVLHIHRHDQATPLEEQIRSFNGQILKGHCKAWGVSNVPPPALSEMLELCEKNGWENPVCYQGCYNLFTRGMEERLLPLLRAHNMAFNVFQNPFGAMVRKLFDGEALIGGMKRFDAAVREKGLTSTEVALRWLAHHSSLGDDDSIIIGASKVQQISDTVSLIRKGPLPDSVVLLAEDLWRGVQESRQHII